MDLSAKGQGCQGLLDANRIVRMWTNIISSSPLPRRETAVGRTPSLANRRAVQCRCARCFEVLAHCKFSKTVSRQAKLSERVPDQQRKSCLVLRSIQKIQFTKIDEPRIDVLLFGPIALCVVMLLDSSNSSRCKVGRLALSIEHIRNRTESLAQR